MCVCVCVCVCVCMYVYISYNNILQYNLEKQTKILKKSYSFLTHLVASPKSPVKSQQA
jgi:ribosomal protein S2